MSRSRLLITRMLPQPVMTEAEHQFEVKAWPHDEPIGTAFDKWSEGCDAVLVMATDRLDRDRLQALARQARAVATYSVGYEHVDLEAATEFRLPVFHTPDVLSDAVAETALLLMLAAARHSSDAESLLRGGGWGPWSPTRFLGTQLKGRIFGIFGMGRIGLAIAERARGFGLRIHYHNRSPVPGAADFTYHETLDSLLAASQIFCVAAPSTPQTRGILDVRRLALLPRGAVLVNIARGDLIDEDALIEAVASGHIGGLGLDVYRNEPRIDPRFLQLPRATLLPHIGSATNEARTEMGMIALRALAGWLNERQAPHNCLNPSTLWPKAVA